MIPDAKGRRYNRDNDRHFADKLHTRLHTLPCRAAIPNKSASRHFASRGATSPPPPVLIGFLLRASIASERTASAASFSISTASKKSNPFFTAFTLVFVSKCCVSLTLSLRERIWF